MAKHPPRRQPRAAGPARPEGTLTIQYLRKGGPELTAFCDSFILIDRDHFADLILYSSLTSVPPHAEARVVLPTQMVREHVWPSVAKFHKEVSDWLSQAGVQVSAASALRETALLAAPARSATLIRAFRFGFDGLIEFYYVSPRDIARAQKEPGPIDAIPVCSVPLPTTVLVGVLEALKPYAGDPPSQEVEVPQ